MEKELIQGSDEWLAWRKSGLGASDSPVIMGKSRFKTKLELWKEKIDPAPSKDKKSFITEKGHRLETIARKRLELETMDSWEPILVEWSENKRIRASLDGYNKERMAIWECKYMGRDKYNALIKGSVIPPEYFDQLMHQVLVTDCKQIYFTGIIDNHVKKSIPKGETEQTTVIIPVTNEHHEYIKETLLPELNKFLYCIDNKVEPDSSVEDVVKLKPRKDLGDLVRKYKKTKESLDKISKEEKELKEKIFGITLDIHNKVQYIDCKITKTTSDSKEVPDYEGYCKEHKIDMGGYMKKVKGRTIKKISFCNLEQ